ncbi:hypothetical protein D0T87_01915 [Bacteroides sp. 51]|nr:hypothetical protein [Bacteroides sp. 51]
MVAKKDKPVIVPKAIPYPEPPEASCSMAAEDAVLYGKNLFPKTRSLTHNFPLPQASICFCGIYVRKKKNRSGIISVVVVSKSSGRYKKIKCSGAVNIEDEAQPLCIETQSRM